MSTKIILVLVLVSFICIGCGPEFIVHIDSINNGEILKQPSYVIIPASNEIQTNDLQFKEFCGYVKRALEYKNYKYTESFDKADLAIIFGYGIGDPEKHTYTYAMPIYGQTGISSSRTYGSLYSSGNYSSYSGTTTYTPSYGVVGAIPMQGSYITYTRYAFLHAFDLNLYRNEKKEITVWKTSIISTGSSGDLRKVFPVLIASSVEYLGENTGKAISETLRENDKIVKQIKGLISRNKE